jgi:hypothetical protein
MVERRGAYRGLVWKPGERNHLENLGVDAIVIFCKLHPVVVYRIRIDAVLALPTTHFIRVL